MNPNPHVIAMLVVGFILLIAGTILGLDGFNSLRKSFGAGELGAGIGLSVLGTLLIIIAWSITAARWRGR